MNTIRNNENFKLLLDNVDCGLYLRYFNKNGESEYIFFNQRMRDLFETDDVFSSVWWEQDIEDSNDKLVLNTMFPLRQEHPFKDENGRTIRWLLFIKKKIIEKNNEDGYHILTSVTDITNLKREEDLANQSRAKLALATIAGSISTWEYVVDEKRFYVTNGLDVKDRSISLEEHLMLRNNSKSIGRYSDLLAVISGEKKDGESFYSVKDSKTGQNKYRKAFFTAVEEDDRVTCVIGLTQDVTDSYEQKELIRLAHEQLKLAIYSVKLSVWKFVPKKNMFYTLQGSALAKDGTSYDDLVSFLNPSDSAKFKSDFSSLLSRKKKYTSGIYRFRNIQEGNEYRYYESTMIWREYDNGDKFEIIGTQRDITDSFLHKQLIEEYGIKTNIINKATKSVMWDYNIEEKVINSIQGDAIGQGKPIPMAEYFSYVAPADRQLTEDTFKKANNREIEDFSIEIGLMLPGADNYKRVIITGVPYKDQNGNIIKYTGIRRDISEQVMLNDILKRDEKIKNVVVNNVNAALYLFSKDCQLIWANNYSLSYTQNLFGRDTYFENGQVCNLCVNHSCTLTKGSCIISDTKEKGIPQTVEVTGRDGKIYEILSYPIFDDNSDSLSSISLVIRDITERRNMIKSIKESHRRAQNAFTLSEKLLDSLPNPIFIQDVNNELRFFRVNTAFCKYLKVQKSQVFGKTLSEVFGEEMAKKYIAYDNALIASKSIAPTISYEASLVVDNKEVIWVINKTTIAFGQRKFILSMSTDISELKETTKQLAIAKDKAQQADKLKSAFLANMSHEIRTPLNSIVGFSELLIDSNDQQEKGQYSNIIKTNTQMLLRLVEDILDISKIESGNTEFKRDLVEVSSFINNLAASLSIKFTNPEVKFIVENPYKTCYINLDRFRLGQVITNFVTNAIKYTKEGHVKLSYYIEKQGLTIKVEDTGIGISQSKRDRVFTRFDKLDSLVQGTGLGLPISKLLTEIGGGKIWFESEEGVGSTFYAWKPFNDIRALLANEGDKTITRETPTEKIEKITTLPNRIKKVLVAEDNDSNYLLLKNYLRDYEVSLAKNGLEAVEMVAKSRYDVVLMDVKMPLMNGLDATRQIRKFNNVIPIVAITADAFALDEEEALREGCNYFLPKPIEKIDLFRVLNKL